MDELNVTLPNKTIKKLSLGKSVVVLGANGAGKTRFGIKIEELNDSDYAASNNTETTLSVQRISAQKSLAISEGLVIKGLETSEKELFIGETGNASKKIHYRFRSKPATHLLDDYNQALSLLFSKNNKLLEDHNKKDTLAIKEGLERPPVLKTLITTVEEIWNDILPHRKLDLSGNEVHAIFQNKNYDDTNIRYHGKEMSDGERVILYMIVQAIIVRENTLIIVDEPELHIHKAVVNKLWDRLEEIRQDCVFMYITHDLDFASLRNTDEILWIKSFDGQDKWDFEFLLLEDYSNLPPLLLFELIGTRKKIIFVEGTSDSLDYLLYQEIYKYKNYHIIPCGGCKQVISCVKAKNKYPDLKDIEVYGVIDRDYRTKEEIDNLEKDGIFCLNVAEVENLFLVPELLKIMHSQFGCEPLNESTAEKFIIKLYRDSREKQIAGAFKKEIDYQFDCVHFDNNIKSADDVKTLIDERFSIENINKIYSQKSSQFTELDDLDQILKIFNEKNLSKQVGSCFGIRGSDYPKRVINLLKFDNIGVKEKIIESLKPYIPDMP